VTHKNKQQQKNTTKLNKTKTNKYKLK